MKPYFQEWMHSVCLFTVVVTKGCKGLFRALLNTGTEWNGTEYTGKRWNETEWTRMVPEYTATSQNDGGMKRNGQEWYRNIPEQARTTLQRREKTLV